MSSNLMNVLLARMLSSSSSLAYAKLTVNFSLYKSLRCKDRAPHTYHTIELGHMHFFVIQVILL